VTLVHPVILSGGSGTRLWPLSRKSRPKQFLPLAGEKSLFAQTLERLEGEPFGPVSVICNNDHRFLVAEQMQQARVTDGRIILEPSARNTAPAVLAAALLAAQEDPGRLLLVLPSDHLIADREEFSRAVRAGVEAALDGHMVTFGVTPDRPETGYGYMETARTEQGEKAPLMVSRFVEKPDAETAEQYLRAGNYYWNAGIFLFTAETMIEAFRAHAPEFLAPCAAAVAEARSDLDFCRLDATAWRSCPADSIDYAIMEKAFGIRCVPLNAGWSDLGAWPAVWEAMVRDGDGNVAHGDVLLKGVRNSFVHSEGGGVLAVLGLDDVVAVATPDAILVASREYAQQVGEVVEELKASGHEAATAHRRIYRPWGWYEKLADGERYQVKTLMVKPGARLSMQSHHHRAEHWVVVRGTVRVTNGEEEFLLSENQSTYIPIGNRHRLENPGRMPALLIEVQSGPYLGEDDIVRYDDDYGRDNEYSPASAMTSAPAMDSAPGRSPKTPIPMTKAKSSSR